MRIYYDCEFLEDGRTIKLISIGLHREDGREYYAVNAGMPWFKITKHEWLMKHVVPNLPTRVYANGHRFLNLDSPYIKNPTEIAEDVRSFIQTAGPDVQLWAWSGAYDHVALCQLWGRMIDLPTGIPKFTNDIRQEFQRLGNPRGPVQEAGEHNALADARHNKVMHDFIRAHEGQMFKEEVLLAMHPEIGYWCDHGLHSGFPPAK